MSKPPGIVVHRSSMARDRAPALQLLRDQLARHVWPVHRLDRGTSGVLLFALDEDAARELHRAFEEGQVRKVYRALVRGDFANVSANEELLVDHPVPKAEGGPEVPRVPARTRFTAEESFGWCSLVRANPETGRFHQIRRHLAHLRYPIANDTNYGTGWFNRKVRADLGLERLALHASRLTLTHAEFALDIEDELPRDFSEALERARLAAAAARDPRAGHPT